MKPVLSTSAVSYAYRSRPIVDRVSIDLEPGRMTVVAGPNGAGKTTLFRLMSGELRPTSGSVLCEGESLECVAPWLLACKRAVMTQAVRVSFPFTVFEVVRLGVDGVGRVAPERRARIVERCLAKADILALASRRFDALSGGEQRRVHFARALAQIEAGASVAERQALLLDEPVANLDLSHQFALMDAAREVMARGVAVLAILHDLNLAARYADTLVLIREGAAVACGSPEEVLSSELVSDVFGLDLAIVESDFAKGPLVLPARWIADGGPVGRSSGRRLAV